MENKNEMFKMNDSELETVAGGMSIPGLGLSFEACTALLKEAGDRAYACSEFTLGGGRFSHLHSCISSAEHAGTNENRSGSLNGACAELAKYPSIPYVKLTQSDYEYIKLRLDKVKQAVDMALRNWIMA